MPALTDDFLGTLFVEAGAAFEVPASGASDIVGRALGTDDGSLDEGRVTPAAETGEPPPGRRTGPGTLRSNRLLAVAAGLIVLAGIVGVGLALRPGTTGSHPTTSVAAGPQRSTATPKAGGPSRSFSPVQGTVQPNKSLSAPSGAAPQSTSPAGQSTKIAQTGSLDLQVPKGALTSTVTALTTLATRAAAHARPVAIDVRASASWPPRRSTTLAASGVAARDAYARPANAPWMSPDVGVPSEKAATPSVATPLAAANFQACPGSEWRSATAYVGRAALKTRNPAVIAGRVGACIRASSLIASLRGE